MATLRSRKSAFDINSGALYDLNDQDQDDASGQSEDTGAQTSTMLASTESVESDAEVSADADPSAAEDATDDDSGAAAICSVRLGNPDAGDDDSNASGDDGTQKSDVVWDPTADGEAVEGAADEAADGSETNAEDHQPADDDLLMFVGGSAEFDESAGSEQIDLGGDVMLPEYFDHPALVRCEMYPKNVLMIWAEAPQDKIFPACEMPLPAQDDFVI